MAMHESPDPNDSVKQLAASCLPFPSLVERAHIPVESNISLPRINVLEPLSYLPERQAGVTDNRDDFHQMCGFQIRRDFPSTPLSENIARSNLGVCEGCTNYSGFYGRGTRLVCGIHPYGCDGDSCADWTDVPITPAT